MLLSCNSYSSKPLSRKFYESKCFITNVSLSIVHNTTIIMVLKQNDAWRIVSYFCAHLTIVILKILQNQHPLREEKTTAFWITSKTIASKLQLKNAGKWNWNIKKNENNGPPTMCFFFFKPQNIQYHQRRFVFFLPGCISIQV